MNTAAVTHRESFQSPLTNVARAAVAIAVVACVGAAWLSAGNESQHAVQATSAALNRTYVTLPTVYITAPRDSVAPVAATRGSARPAL